MPLGSTPERTAGSAMIVRRTWMAPLGDNVVCGAAPAAAVATARERQANSRPNIRMQDLVIFPLLSWINFKIQSEIESLRARQQQSEQLGAAFAVDDAVDAIGAEAALEGDHGLFFVGHVIAEALEREQEAGIGP